MITALEGTVGAGKTIFMVLFSIVYRLKGYTIYANFKLVGALDIDKVSDLRILENCIVFIDDIIAWMDARQSMSNTFTTHLLMASRKKRVQIVYSQQVKIGADIRLRNITDLYIFPWLDEFPLFGFEMWIGYPDDQDSEYLGEFDVTFGPEVFEAYNTYEVAYQKVSYNELYQLYVKVENKDLFNTVVNVRYSITKVNAGNLFNCFRLKDPELRKELIDDILAKEGYVVV